MANKPPNPFRFPIFITLFIFISAFFLLVINVFYKPAPKQEPKTSTPSWQTYTNSNLDYTIQYPDNWFVAKSQIMDGVSTLWLGGNNPPFNYSKSHNLEIIIGSPYVYSWSKETCANQLCKQETSFNVTINNHVYKFNVTNVSDTTTKQFKYFTFQIENNQNNPNNFIGTYFNFKQQEQIIQILSTYRPLLPPDTSSWHTYSNQLYNYSIKYPSNYFINTQSNNLKISNQPDFDKNESGLVITIEPRQNNLATQDPNNLKIVDDVGYGNLIEKYFGRLGGGAFLGDPPWGYYNIYFSANPGTANFKMMQISVRVHRSDDMPTSESGTAGKIKAIAKSIISTLQLNDSK